MASTDKISLGYLPTYERLATELGVHARVCEVGVHQGGSLELWRALFPQGLIVGVDNEPTCAWPEHTTKILSSQDAPDLPDRLREISGFFDLIVDDASHKGDLTAGTFALLWPLVRQGGVYVIEDWMVGFPDWGAGQDDLMLDLARSLLDHLRVRGEVDSMHPEAMLWVGRFATAEPLRVLDLGGRDNNGSPRSLFPNAAYTVLDLEAGVDVNIVADAASWTPDQDYDLVISTELFEHTPVWPAILATAFAACRSGGRLVATMAGPGRPAHGQHGAAGPAPGEFYANVDPVELWTVLAEVGWRDIQVDVQPSPADVRCSAVKP